MEPATPWGVFFSRKMTGGLMKRLLVLLGGVAIAFGVACKDNLGQGKIGRASCRERV